MKPKKTALICIVAVLALALMGFGFAKWSDTVAINAEVATGNVDVEIEALGVNDEGPDPNIPPGNNSEDKDVASIECVNVDENTIKVTISNAYPWYQPGFMFRINGVGTVPVKVEDVIGPNWDGELGDFIKVASWKITVHNPASNGLEQYDDVISSEGETSWDDLFDALKYIQLHQDGFIEVEVNLYIIEEIGEELAPEEATTTGTITINVAQWNEVFGPVAE